MVSMEVVNLFVSFTQMRIFLSCAAKRTHKRGWLFACQDTYATAAHTNFKSAVRRFIIKEQIQQPE